MARDHVISHVISDLFGFYCCFELFGICMHFGWNTKPLRVPFGWICSNRSSLLGVLILSDLYVSSSGLRLLELTPYRHNCFIGELTPRIGLVATASAYQIFCHYPENSMTLPVLARVPPIYKASGNPPSKY